MSDPVSQERASTVDEVRDEYQRRTNRYNAHTPAERRMFDLLMGRVLRQYEQMFERNGLLPLGDRNVLDVGSGRNEWLVACRQQWGQTNPELCGIELMPDRVAQGLTDYPYLQLRCGSADRLPWPDNHFALTHQGMLLTSVLDAALRERIVAEIRRVTRPGGMFVWYDFVWNPVNRHAEGIPLKQVRAYFRGWELIDRRRVTLAPPLARRLARFGEPLIDLAESLRFLNFWQLILFRKPS